MRTGIRFGVQVAVVGVLAWGALPPGSWGNVNDYVANQLIENNAGDQPECVCPDTPSEALLSCVLIKINAGALRPGSSVKSALFRMGENQFSETIYTPQALNFVVGYAMKGISHERTRDGAPRQVTLIENGGVPFVVNFKDGESIGMPVFGDDMIKKLRVFMVDANGWSPSPPAASSPTPPSATPTAAPATPSKTASARPPIRTGHTLRLRRPR